MNFQNQILAGLLSLFSLPVLATPQASIDQNRCLVYETAGNLKQKYFVYLKNIPQGEEVSDGYASLEKPLGQHSVRFALSKLYFNVERTRFKNAPLQNNYIIVVAPSPVSGIVAGATGEGPTNLRLKTEQGMVVISCPSEQ